MSIQELGSIGEFVGSIAVFITLVYLAIQVRQNIRHVRAQMGHDGWISSVDYELARMQQAAAEAIARSEFDPNALTDSDIIILDSFYTSLLFHVARVEHTNSQGLEIYSIEQSAQAFVVQFNSRTGRAWLKSNQALTGLLAPNVVKRIEELCEHPETISRHASATIFRNHLRGEPDKSSDGADGA